MSINKKSTQLMSTLTKTCHMLYLSVRKNNQLYLVLFASHFVIDMSTLQVSGKDLNKLAYIPEAEEGPSTH